jgi:hypothetical protein
MKKFYISVITAIFFFLSVFSVHAQTVYQTTAAGTVLTPLLLSQNSSWQGGLQPPNHCTDCKIIINSPSTIDDAVGKVIIDVSSTSSEIDVLGGNNVLTIDQWIELHNTKVVVSNNATVFVNDEVDMYGSTVIELANGNAVINANNDDGHIVNGTGTPANDLGQGLYLITATSGTVITAYDATLSSLGMGKSDGTGFINHYTISCGSPNICGSGLVFGPSITEDSTSGAIPASWFQFVGLSTPLPVELVQFTAGRNADQTINVSWMTAQETNASYYGVERSGDASNWRPLGTVKARGFSSTTSSYQYKDGSPLGGTNYYRLKMVDLDGKFKYSNVVSVSSDAKGESLVIYNNPFTDMIRIKVNIPSADNLILTVTDIVGKTYISETYHAAPGDNFINLNPQGAAQGMYLLHIQGNTYDKTVKLVKE